MRYALLALIIFSTYYLKGQTNGFVKNHGQWPDSILYMTLGPEGNIALTKNSIVYVRKQNYAVCELNSELKQNSTVAFFSQQFIHANSEVEVISVDTLPTRYHFYKDLSSLGTHTNVTCHSEILFREFYPGIDFRVKISKGNLKYEFHKKSYANIESIQWFYRGIKPAIGKSGGLTFDLGFMQLEDSAPIIIENGNSLPDDMASISVVNDIFRYSVDSLLLRKEFIIDPEIHWSSYYFNTPAQSITSHASGASVHFSGGNIYTLLDLYPNVQPGINLAADLSSTMFISKLSANGQEVEWMALIGDEVGNAISNIVFAEDGSIYAACRGYGGQFPVGQNALDSYDPNFSQRILFHLSQDGDSLLGSTYFNWNNAIHSSANSKLFVDNIFINYNKTILAADSSKLFFAASIAALPDEYGDFPIAGEFNPDTRKLFISSLDSELSEINWGLIIDCGVVSELDEIYVTDLLVVDSVLYFAGSCTSPGLAVTPNSLQQQLSGTSDGFFGGVDKNTGELLVLSYFGSEGFDEIRCLAWDGENLLLGGRTDHPQSLPSVQQIWGDGQAWVCRLNPLSLAVQECYAIGSDETGFNQVDVKSVGVDNCNKLILNTTRQRLTGFNDPEPDYLFGWPITANALNSTAGTSYFARFSNGELDFGSYFGGGYTHAWSLNRIYSGRLYLGSCVHAGWSPYGDINATPGAFESFGGFAHANMTVIDFNDSFIGDISAEPMQHSLSQQCGYWLVTLEAPPGATNYLWDFGDGNQAQTSLSGIQHQYNLAGSYEGQLIVSNPLACNGSDTLLFTIDIPDPYQFQADWSLPHIDPCLSPQTLNLSAAISSGATYNWQLPDNTSIANQNQVAVYIPAPGSYPISLHVHDSICGSDTILSTLVVIHEKLNADVWYSLVSDSCGINHFQGNVLGSGIDSIHWDSGNNVMSNEPTVHFSYPSGHYLVHLNLLNSLCLQEESYEFEISSSEIVSETSLSIPNIFTPNQDGINDYLHIAYPLPKALITKFEFKLFDRWGSLVFTSTDPSFTWDGQGISAGTYFYTLSFSNTCTNEENNVTGSLTVTK